MAFILHSYKYNEDNQIFLDNFDQIKEAKGSFSNTHFNLEVLEVNEQGVVLSIKGERYNLIYKKQLKIRFSIDEVYGLELFSLEDFLNYIDSHIDDDNYSVDLARLFSNNYPESADLEERIINLLFRYSKRDQIDDWALILIKDYLLNNKENDSTKREVFFRLYSSGIDERKALKWYKNNQEYFIDELNKLVKPKVNEVYKSRSVIKGKILLEANDKACIHYLLKYINFYEKLNNEDIELIMLASSFVTERKNKVKDANTIGKVYQAYAALLSYKTGNYDIIQIKSVPDYDEDTREIIGYDEVKNYDYVNAHSYLQEAANSGDFIALSILKKYKKYHG